MVTNFSPCKGSYVLNQFPSNVMFGMNGFHVSASGAIQGHHGPLVSSPEHKVLRMSYCDSAVSVVHHQLFFWLVYALEATFLAPLAKGQRAIVMAWGRRASVRSSVRASVNFFFKKLLLRNY